jgi:hypothetical protein
MQFKMDENLHAETADLFRQHGHDAVTVFDEGLQGHADVDIADVCRREQRALVTLDLDSRMAQTPFSEAATRMGPSQDSPMAKRMEAPLPPARNVVGVMPNTSPDDS